MDPNCNMRASDREATVLMILVGGGAVLAVTCVFLAYHHGLVGNTTALIAAIVCLLSVFAANCTPVSVHLTSEGVFVLACAALTLNLLLIIAVSSAFTAVFG